MRLIDLEELCNLREDNFVEDLLFTVFESRINMSKLDSLTLFHLKKSINLELKRRKFYKNKRK